jgi:uncharacterized membrane protein YphA (DoxX/SURF4 family)
MTTSQTAQRILVHVFLALAALQFFLAGLGVFRHNPSPNKKIIESSTFDPHRIVGDLTTLVVIIIAILALITRWELQMCLLLFGLMVVQFLLAGLGEDTPVFGALHALNGVALLGTGVVLLTRLRPAGAPRATSARRA